MPMIRNPAVWIMFKMSPTAFFFTASGLMIANVRCVFMCLKCLVSILDCEFLFLTLTHGGDEGLTDDGRRFHDAYACRFEGLHFFCRGAVSAGDDGAGMAHAASWRRGLSCNKRDDGFFYVLLYVISRD